MKLKLAFLIGLLILLVTLQLFPLIQQFLLHPDPMYLQTYIQSKDGILLLFLLQSLQIFLFFIPAFPIQITASLVYGFTFGTTIIYLSYFLTTLLLYYLIPKDTIVFEKLTKRYQYLYKHHFLLYLIPSIPTCIKPYITKIENYRFSQFLFTLSIAPLPSIVLATLIGTALKYQYYSFAILFAFLLILFTLCTYLYLFLKVKKR